MGKRQQLLPAIQQANAAIVQHLIPSVRAAIQESVFHDVPGWFHLGLAYAIRPDALTVERLQVRNPYSKADKLAQEIVGLKEAGFLDEAGIITQQAYDAYQKLIDVQDAATRKLNHYPLAKFDKVNGYLKRIIAEALKGKAPVLADTTNTPLMEYPIHQFYDLASQIAAFRDDAHLQAWQATGVDGHTFEAFSLIWDGSADGAEKLMEIRAIRGYEEHEWQTTLDALVAQNWLDKTDDSYTVPDAAAKQRQAIEDKTDEIFYQPFGVISDEEVLELLALLQEVQDAFSPEPETS